VLNPLRVKVKNYCSGVKTILYLRQKKGMKLIVAEVFDPRQTEKAEKKTAVDITYHITVYKPYSHIRLQ
jgi:hypothetical protein